MNEIILGDRCYGYVTRHRGEDEESLDVYLGPHLSSDRIFKVHQNQVTVEGDRLRQVTGNEGMPLLDEYKYMIFFETTGHRLRKPHY